MRVKVFGVSFRLPLWIYRYDWSINLLCWYMDKTGVKRRYLVDGVPTD